MSVTYLIGDIGGTNARIHLYKIQANGPDWSEELQFQHIYSSRAFSSLSDVVVKFFTDFEIDELPKSACFSVAGPVKNGSVCISNLGWSTTEEELGTELGIEKVTLINDFASCGYGLSLLKEEELFPLTVNRKSDPNGPKIIIGAGTGLGEAFRVEVGGKVTVMPGEGGHTDFAPRNNTEFNLMQYIKRKLDLSRVGVERVVSGPGIEHIYGYFCESMHNLENHEHSDIIRNSECPSSVISKLAADKNDILCEKTMRLFVQCYGAEAGNLALTILPSGGVYIAGGIAPKIRDVMKEEFIKAFFEKGRMRKILVEYPINIIMNTSVGILGARYIAMCSIRNKESDKKLTIRMNTPTEHPLLLSEQPELYSTTERCNGTDRRVRRGSVNGGKAKNENTSAMHFEETVYKTSNSKAENLVWMGFGFCFSFLLIGSYLLGKSSE